VELNAHYGDLNGFLGFIPEKLILQKKDELIYNQEAYNTFYDSVINDVTPRNFWIKKDLLFPNLVLCGEVQRQISRIGNSAYFKQIIVRLKELNSAASKWTTGNFSYNDININYNLRISPESSFTMDSYGNERLFSMPGGGTQTFELHIKTGDLRFHFYPDNATRIIYVGYIGPHLNTVSN
jgi:hypothetical protein